MDRRLSGPPSRASLPALLIAVVIGLAGCGGSDGGDGNGGATSGAEAGGAEAKRGGGAAGEKAGGESDRQTAQATFDKVFKTNHDDPSNCERVYTERYVNDSFGKEEPLKECRKQQQELYDEDDKADEVKITRLEVTGDQADAAITVRGGFSDGVKFDVKLVREGDDFKLDDLEPR